MSGADQALRRREVAGYGPLLLQIEAQMRQKQPLLIAIDGRCGSGKTQLSALLQTQFPCRVFHTDHYYLPVAQRPADWRQRPAGNMDLERLRTEVLLPAQRGETVRQRIFDCAAQRLGEPQTVPPAPLTVVEGSYSLHPALNGAYDMRIFLTCSDTVQQARLQAREGEHYDMFRQVWIPMEELYYARCRLLDTHPILVDTTCFFCESTDSLSK
ncbi:uridine kinase family protein [Agathobaculum sp. Marseille-P7918]|uniref:uridine kinase family protein n=1 Tax=Agathobaculum sp. Marseille-P7918 TaxID=2479843 RepID=UPI000F644172|nr:uridine kinase [Agathobaculum sp. Marseille-P7918]